MKTMKATTMTSVLKTLTVALVLTITSQAYAQHTQGPTIEGVALPSLSGEEGEITEDQVLEVQRQCNENLVKEYLYNGSGGKIGLVGKLEMVNNQIPVYSDKATVFQQSGYLSSDNKISIYQELKYNDESYSKLYLEIYKNVKSDLSVSAYANDVPSFLVITYKKIDVDSMGSIKVSKSFVSKLSVIKFDTDVINFVLNSNLVPKDKIIFSYPTAKYVSCLKAGIAALAK